MPTKIGLCALCLSSLFLAAALRSAEPPFAEQVGPVRVGAAPGSDAVRVPYITWGGDMVTFHANGGLHTHPDSIFGRQGLRVDLTPGDDFHQQVRDYVSGRSPFLRGTFGMIGMAAEMIGSDPRTQGVVVLQLTWSAGDHLIAREGIKRISDLKGRAVALQRGGPHVSMLDDILKTAQLNWSDIRVVWTKDLTGSADCPAQLLRERRDIDACFAISPDMIGLCGGLRRAGSGAEGTLKGAHVLVSTAEMTHSIADVYVCRKDFYDAHRDWVAKFVAGYMKATEDVVALKKRFDGKGPVEYRRILALAQEVYGKKTLPSLEEDAHGLLSDCLLAGYPGNVAFFTEAGNLHGFDPTQRDALNLAVALGYARTRTHLLPPDFDFAGAPFKGYLSRTEAARAPRFQAEALAKEVEELNAGTALDSRTIVSFTIHFEPNQSAFSATQYEKEYQRVVQLADKYGNAVVTVRGHADPTKTLLELVKAGIAKNVLTRSGSNGAYSYAVQGRPFDLAATNAVVALIESGAFDGVPDHDPRECCQAALNLSRKRAEAVRDSIVEYAKTGGLRLDRSQIQPVGVGIREPFIAKPAGMDEARRNMRVEFRLIRVDAETSSPSDFDL